MGDIKTFAVYHDGERIKAVDIGAVNRDGQVDRLTGTRKWRRIEAANDEDACSEFMRQAADGRFNKRGAHFVATL